tara:strand:+ start:8615 stop:10072 length:1458 start_codon:yes stop_codon:yes gene_type:complete
MEIKLPKLRSVDPNKPKKKKILLLSDDMRLHSGVGTVSKNLVFGTVDRYDWVQLGGAVKHPDNGKLLDISDQVKTETGVDDADVKIYPCSGYGTQEIVRHIISQEKPDAIIHFTDPRFWQWLYQMEHEIRQTIPLGYLNIWDDLPYPHWNEPFYDSCDLLMAISKQTYNINFNVCQKNPRRKGIDLTYVQHGIPTDEYYPIGKDHPEFNELIKFEHQIFGGVTPGFVVMYNSRNIRRKSTSDLMLAYKLFCDRLTKEQANECYLLLHTNKVDDAGTDLGAVKDALLPDYNVIFSEAKLTTKQLNYLYNMSDLGANISSAEGFGLSCMESIMTGTPVLVNCIGGLQDQVGIIKDDGKYVELEDYNSDWPSNSNGRYKNHGEWSFVVWPQINLQGSPLTPYIYDSRCNIPDVTDQIEKAYRLGVDELKTRGMKGRDWAIENGFTAKEMCNAFERSIESCWKHWKPRKRFTLIDSQKPKPKYPVGHNF